MIYLVLCFLVHHSIFAEIQLIQIEVCVSLWIVLVVVATFLQLLLILDYLVFLLLVYDVEWIHIAHVILSNLKLTFIHNVISVIPIFEEETSIILYFWLTLVCLFVLHVHTQLIVDLIDFFHFAELQPTFLHEWLLSDLFIVLVTIQLSIE